jgi:hypothetical protein
MKMKIFKGEKGQVLPLVMIAIAFGALVIPPFLNSAGTSLIGSRNYRQSLEAQYAADSGAEHAIWELKYGGLGASFKEIGDKVDYILGENVNGVQVYVAVEKTGEPSSYSIVTTAGNSVLNVSASINATTIVIYSWQLN